MTHRRNVQGLVEDSESRSARADDAILDALRIMLRLGVPITVSELARRADVHRSTIYARTEVMDEVKKAQSTQGPVAPPRTAAGSKSAAAINKALQAENKKLRRDLRAAQQRIGDLLAEQRLSGNVVELPSNKQAAN